MNAIIIKVGGSLALHPQNLRNLCAKLTELSKKHKLIIMPGGGEFADAVRDLDKRFTLSATVSHRMAILGMDQYGLLLSDLFPNSTVINHLDRIKVALSSGRVPIFSPSTLMLKEDPLENSWEVTSDSIAAYLCGRLGLKKLILITDVDGIYANDPKTHPNAELIRALSSSELLKMRKRTSVDQSLPNLLTQFHIECLVVNGLHPERVQAILEGQQTDCTLITAK